MAQRSKENFSFVPARFDFWGRKIEGPPRQEPILFLLGFIFCVCFPEFVTIIAPASRIILHSDGNTVSAKVQSLVFLTIPYRTIKLDTVTGLTSQISTGHLERDNSVQGESREIRTEDSAELVLAGANRNVSIMVSPVNLRSVKQQVQSFIEQPGQRELSLFVVANWKASVLVGGPLSVLTLLFLTYQFAAASKGVYRILRSRLSRIR